jgi:5-methylthioribose kinase
MTLTLSVDTAETYLRGRGLIPDGARFEVEELGWGISNVVLRATIDDDCIVVKQSLPELRVAEEWRFDRSRIVVERTCMAYLNELLPTGCVPEVRFADDDNFLFGMSCAPPGGRLWKEELLAGRIDLRAAEHAGRLLAEIHRRAALDRRARELFVDRSVLIQGRIDPYHRTAAVRNPRLAPLIEAEVERLLGEQKTLVLGDYSPKNIFVYRDHALTLDLEVAHFGDPAFDTAFCLTHLFLKAFAFPERASAYARVAQTFWETYAHSVGSAAGPIERVEAHTVRELGCLLLARIDGKSKIEYVTGDRTKETIRKRAREILLGNEQRLEPLIERINGSRESGSARTIE